MVSAVEIVNQLAQQGARLGRQDAGGLLIELERPLGPQIARAINQFDQRFGALLEPRHGRAQALPKLRRELGRQLRPAGNMRQDALDLSQQFAVRALTDVVAVEAVEPRQVKRAGERPICGRSNAAISSSVEKISWSPWLQPSRDR